MLCFWLFNSDVFLFSHSVMLRCWLKLGLAIYALSNPEFVHYPFSVIICSVLAGSDDGFARRTVLWFVVLSAPFLLVDDIDTQASSPPSFSNADACVQISGYRFFGNWKRQNIKGKKSPISLVHTCRKTSDYSSLGPFTEVARSWAALR